METIFLLAERIVHQLNRSFLGTKDTIATYYFKECIIQYSSSFKIIFTDGKSEIVLFLSLHHLDIPWKIEVAIIGNNSSLDFNNLMLAKQNRSSIYDVYPNLLKDPNGLGNDLAEKLAEDLLTFLKKEA